MSIKLGELLVKHHMITEGQLAEALRAQHTFGGRLGTNLVELGYLSDQALTKFLSAQLSIPAIGSGELDSISQDALAAMPRPTAEKYRVVPLSISGRKLRVATAEPTDLKALDEISFATGCSIQPFVAPELLITYALEKYYGIIRRTRYVRLTGTTDAEFQVAQPSASPDATTSGLPGGRTHGEEPGNLFKQERKDLLYSAYDLKQASKDLAAVSQSRDVFEILKRFARQHFERAIIFVLRGARVMGWDQIGCAISETDLRQVSIAPDENTILGQALESRAAFVGSVPSSRSGDWLATLLQLDQDRAAFALSVTVNNQAVSILIASAPIKGELADHLIAYDALAAKMSYSLQMVYLRKRILEA